MKIFTNSRLVEKKSNWIDFNAGILLDSDEPDRVTDELMNKIVATANGGKLRHEAAGAKEIAIFKNGVTL